MKKLLLLIIALPFFAKGTVYTSVASGDWRTPATWGLGSGFPSSLDTAIINNTVTVISSDVEALCWKLIINNGGVLNNSATIAIEDKLVNNTGGKFEGSGAVALVGRGANDTIISGGGDFSSQTSNWNIQGLSTGAQTMIIAPSVKILKNSGSISLATVVGGKPLSVLNFGTVELLNGEIVSNGTSATSWTEEANTLLLVAYSSFRNSYDTLIASANGNTVAYEGNSSYSIKTPAGGNYYDVYIANGTKSMPSALSIHTLGIGNPSTTVNMNGQNITLSGNLQNYGTVINNTGTITFNGSSLQKITGTHSVRFANMTISGSGGVTLAISSGFTGVLTLSGSGSLASSGGTDTLISSSGSTARVAQITSSGTITANFVVQRYDGRSTAEYQVLSSPVTSTTLGDWNTSNRNPKFYMSGVGGPDGNAGSYVSVYIYGETTNTYNEVTSYSNPGINYVLPKGQGIYLWMGNSLTSMSPFTYITHGVPTTGTVNVNVTYTSGEGNGFNMIGNPYPSPISWSSLAGGNSSLQNAYYLFEEDGSWHTFITGSFISMEQGIGVVTTSSTAITFKESYKSTTDASLESAGDPSKQENNVLFTLSTDANKYSCPTIVSFNNSSLPEYSPSEDAIFIKSFIQEVPQLFTYSADNKSLSLNRLPDNADEIDVPLVAVGNAVGNYTLSSANINRLAAYNCISLADASTGAILNNFEDNASYTFAISQIGEVKNFILKFKRLSDGESCPSIQTAGANSPENIRIYPGITGAVAEFNLPQQENVLISVYSVLGQKLMKDIYTVAYNNTVNIPLPSTTTDKVYVVRIETPNGVTVKKLIY